MLSLIPSICFLCYKTNKKIDTKDSIKYSILSGLLPCLVLWSKTALADIFLVFLSWVVLLLFILITQVSSYSKTKINILSFLMGIISVYAYAVHARGIAITLATFLLIFYNNLKYEKKINFVYYLIGALIILKIDSYFDAIITPKIWTTGAGYNTASSFLAGYENVDKLGMLKSVGYSLIGAFFSINAYSLGIAFLGMCFVCYALFHRKGKNQVVVITELFIVLLFVFQLIINISFLSPGVYKIINGESNARNDQLVYCRYIASSVQMFIFMFYLQLQDYKKKKIKWISITLLYIIDVLFLFFIYSYFSEGTVAWLQMSGIFLYLPKISGVLIPSELFCNQFVIVIIVQVIIIGIVAIFHVSEKIWQTLILILSIASCHNWLMNGYVGLTDYYYEVLDEASDFCTKYIDSDTRIMFDMDRGWYAAQYILSDYDIVLRQEDYSEIVIFGEKENLSNYVGTDYFVVQDYDNSIVVKGLKLAKTLEEKGLTLYECK